MTERVQPAFFVGGPLDGQTVKPATKWPQYIADDGTYLPVKHGDRIFGTRPHAGKIRSCYILRVDYGKRSYVHSSTLPVL